MDESYRRYGFPVTGALEDKIEHSNIHGWLQGRIINGFLSENKSGHEYVRIKDALSTFKRV